MPRNEDQRSRRRNTIVLLLLWALFFCTFTLFTPPLLDDADSVHAEVAREMLLRHDYVTLYANSIRYLEKAPLFYWAMAGSFQLFGPTTAAARLPLALSVLALALLLASFARRAFAHPRAGLYAGLITLSSFGIFIFSRINIPDVLVCVLLTAALDAFSRTEPEANPQRWPAYAFAAACALDILTKGLIGLVFPLAIVTLYLLATRGLHGSLTRLRQLHPLSSAAIFLALAAPWHLLAALANPAQGHPARLSFSAGQWHVPLPTEGNVHGWAWFYFVNEQLLRYLNLRVPRDYDTVPLWLFLGLLLAWLFPWSAFLPQALARALPLRSPGYRHRLRTRTLTPVERTQLLLLLWAALPLAFFALSTRQEYYVLPSLPPLILLIANLLTSARPLRWETRALLAVAAAGTSVSLYFLLNTHTPSPGTDVATLLTQNPADYALSFGHLLDLNPRALSLFRLPLALTPVALLGIALPNYLLRRRHLPHAATLTLTAGAFVLLFASWTALVIFSPALTSNQLARAIAPQLHPGDLIVIHGEYEAGSTLGFYLHRPGPAGGPLHILEGRSANLWYGSFFPDAPPIFETRASLAAKWRSPQRIFLWQDPSDHDRPALTAGELGAPIYVIASGGGKQILSNRPDR